MRSNCKYCKHNLQEIRITTTPVSSWAMMKIHQKSGQTVPAPVRHHTHMIASVKEKLKRNKSAKPPFCYDFNGKESCPW